MKSIIKYFTWSYCFLYSLKLYAQDMPGLSAVERLIENLQDNLAPKLGVAAIIVGAIAMVFGWIRRQTYVGIIVGSILMFIAEPFIEWMQSIIG